VISLDEYEEGPPDLSNLHGATDYGEDPDPEYQRALEKAIEEDRVCAVTGCYTILSNPRSTVCKKHSSLWRRAKLQAQKLCTLAREKRTMRPPAPSLHFHDDQTG